MNDDIYGGVLAFVLALCLVVFGYFMATIEKSKVHRLCVGKSDFIEEVKPKPKGQVVISGENIKITVIDDEICITPSDGVNVINRVIDLSDLENT